jgi:Na+-driven multidrug efflux pump
VTKLFFDACLVFGIITPELGIEGAAAASVLAEFFGAVYLTFYINNLSKIKLSLKSLTRQG